jgi:hypothetical protein
LPPLDEKRYAGHDHDDAPEPSSGDTEQQQRPPRRQQPPEQAQRSAHRRLDRDPAGDGNGQCSAGRVPGDDYGSRETGERRAGEPVAMPTGQRAGARAVVVPAGQPPGPGGGLVVPGGIRRLVPHQPASIDEPPHQVDVLADAQCRVEATD